MKQTSLRILYLTIGSIALLLLQCESLLDIEVGILWMDDTRFSQLGSAYLCVLKGKWDFETGFDDDILDTTEVVPGTNGIHKFSINTGESDHFTALIFIDNNDNGTYDEGYNGVGV